MHIKENIKMAFRSLLSSKMRSLLTMLGVIIGISSVTLIMALGQGGKEKMMNQIQSIGTSTIIVSTSSQDSQNLITDKDVSAIKSKLSGVAFASARDMASGKVTSGTNAGKSAMLALGNEDLLNIANSDLLFGRNFTKEEYDSAKSLCILDEMAAKFLFGDTDVVGERVPITIKDKSINFLVVGVAKSLTADFSTDDMPLILYAPSSCVNMATGKSGAYKQILISANAEENTQTIGNNALAFLSSRHGVRGENVYSAEMMISQVEQINSVIDIFTTIMALVAAISLLVGGIGVMNIMLVSVTERTREIGIRKAIGAKAKNIMFQFLTESAIITFAGGLIGLALGALSAIGIGSFIGFSPVFSVGAIAMSLAFSLAVGLFFGLYPAKKATKMKPVDALGHLE